MTPDTVVGHSPEIAWVSSDDRVVIVRLDDLAAEPLVLSGSAAAIWVATEAPATLEEIVGRVASGYARPPSDIADEVAGFIETCRELGILK